MEIWPLESQLSVSSKVENWGSCDILQLEESGKKAVQNLDMLAERSISLEETKRNGNKLEP